MTSAFSSYSPLTPLLLVTLPTVFCASLGAFLLTSPEGDFQISSGGKSHEVWGERGPGAYLTLHPSFTI